MQDEEQVMLWSDMNTLHSHGNHVYITAQLYCDTAVSEELSFGVSFC